MKKLLLLLLVAVVGCQTTPEVTKRIRYNAHSQEAIPHLEAMDKAFGIMKSLDCDDPRSWYYQGAIHWIPDSIPNNLLCDSYATSESDLKLAWDNCTHSEAGAEEVHFLAWHRIYTYYLEDIIRELSGMDDFALPYWGYTNNNDTDKIMPEIFRDSTSNLFEAARYKPLNEGVAINNNKMGTALDLTVLMQYTDYQLFNSNADAAPHGAMHNYIGNGARKLSPGYDNKITQTETRTGLMGNVPTAGFDPIFWMHHSNIDRIYQQWTNSKNGTLITEQMLDNPAWGYIFFNGKGEKVEYTMGDLREVLYSLDYDYDDTPVYEKPNTVSKIRNIVQQDELVGNTIVANEEVNLGTLTTPEDYNGERQVIEIVVAFDEEPTGIWTVFDNGNTLGYMTFFGATHHAGHSNMPGMKITKTFKYEVATSDLHNLTIKENDEGGSTFEVVKITLYSL
jgi:hypothetical protein